MTGEDPLADEPFAASTHADGTVVISFRGRPVTVLRGAAAARLLTRLEGAEAADAQQVMARATGTFKRGNERSGQVRRRGIGRW